MLSAYSLADSMARSACLPFGDVAEDEDHADDVAPVILDGRGTVVDGPLAAVPGDEEGVVPEPDGQPSLDDLPDRLLDGLPRRLVDDAKDLLDLHPGRVGERPAGERLGDGIEVVHAAVSVGGDDAVADGGEGDLEPITPVEDRIVAPSRGGLARRLEVAHLGFGLSSLVRALDRACRAPWVRLSRHAFTGQDRHGLMIPILPAKGDDLARGPGHQPRIPASWRICSTPPRAPESAIRKTGLRSTWPSRTSLRSSSISSPVIVSRACVQASRTLLYRSSSVMIPRR